MRNVTSSLISEVCKDVQVEPQLQLWTGESFAPSTATGNEVRLDVCARGFWQGSQMAFFDVRVFNPSARRYAKQELSKTYKLNEKEKKRLHNERIMQVEHGTFTPLVMSATEWIGPESSKFHLWLSELISEKRWWIRWKIIFALIASMACIWEVVDQIFNEKNLSNQSTS